MPNSQSTDSQPEQSSSLSREVGHGVQTARTVFTWIVLFFGALFSVGCLWVTYDRWANDPRWNELALQHFAAMVGIPVAALVAIFVVLALGATVEGPIEVKGLSFEFKGAAGPAILWAILFLAFAGAIRLLWST